MISRFFIDRPIFAAVLSLMIALAGGVTVFSLPIAQYPEIAPPTVQVSCAYPGASAKVVADTVAAPIEQQVNGVENMLYMSSQCTNDGSYNLIVTFDGGTDLKLALVQVQNRVSLAMPQLPPQVQQQGVNVKKKSPNILLAVNLISPDGRYDDLYLSNYATIQLKDELARLPGVGDIVFLGQRDYSIRVWLDPDQLAARNLVATDVVRALREQNVQVAAGQLGQQPAPRGQEIQPVLTTLGRLTRPEQFGDIIVRTGTAGVESASTAMVRLRDVARVELGAQQYDMSCALDDVPSVGLAIFQLPGTNALATADGIKKKMEELGRRFPEGIDYRIVYDTTPFIRESIHEVFKTLRDAIILVGLVVLIFLQNWRATLIPMIAVPVALLGTFAVMAVVGFSLNNLSLFGLVLAIGIVVDDAIVVVENVERWMAQGLAPRAAAIRAMEEVTGPVIAVALVLGAVFIPCAFIRGITGQFFRQFALTIAVSTGISAFNSLTLSPALAALLLQPHGARRDPLAWLLDLVLGWFFKLFNAVFTLSTAGYTRLVGLLLRGSTIALLVYGGLLYLTYYGFMKVPAGFIPQQDKGYLIVDVQLDDAASVQRTQDVMARVETIARSIRGVKHTVAIAGQSLLLNANACNFGSMYVMLDEFDARRGPGLDDAGIARQLRARFDRDIRDASAGVFRAPPVDGLGTAGGFKLMIEDRGGGSLDHLQAAADAVVAKGNETRGLQGLATSLRADTPWLYLDIDREKAKAMGVSLTNIFDALQVYVGSLYVNNFNQFNRTWQVIVQAGAAHRHRVGDVLQLQVRNQKGDMVPLATLANVRNISGPVLVQRYNMYPAAPVNGNSTTGTSSGQAIELLDAVARRALPATMTPEWTELAFMEIQAGNTAMYIFALAVVLVFLVLAAQYESWSLPLAIILVVPMCLLCSVAGVAWANMDINIFTQIGFVVLVGLASKNAILIVEFAKQRREAGETRRDATLDACRLRLRPILMTSFAFILGVVPLVLAAGAGAEMRRMLGMAVFAGMLGVTLFGIFLTPVFFYVIQWFADRRAYAAKVKEAIGAGPGRSEVARPHPE